MQRNDIICVQRTMNNFTGSIMHAIKSFRRIVFFLGISMAFCGNSFAAPVFYGFSYYSASNGGTTDLPSFVSADIAGASGGSADAIVGTSSFTGISATGESRAMAASFEGRWQASYSGLKSLASLSVTDGFTAGESNTPYVLDWGVTDPILSGRDQANPGRDDLPAGRRPYWPMRT